MQFDLLCNFSQLRIIYAKEWNTDAVHVKMADNISIVYIYVWKAFFVLLFPPPNLYLPNYVLFGLIFKLTWVPWAHNWQWEEWRRKFPEGEGKLD